MTILLVAMTIIYIIVMLYTYSNIIKVISALIIIFGVMIGTLIYGIIYFQSHEEVDLFGKMLKSGHFIMLMSGWFIMNIIATIKILRTYFEYKRVNTKK